jgi:hypothetical protein
MKDFDKLIKYLREPHDKPGIGYKKASSSLESKNPASPQSKGKQSQNSK